jgi:hypothetical protein
MKLANPSRELAYHTIFAIQCVLQNTERGRGLMLRVLDRVFERHPQLTQADIESAWAARLKTQFRLDGDKEYMVAIGMSATGKLLQMIAFTDNEDTVIFHAMKATKKTLSELDMI